MKKMKHLFPVLSPHHFLNVPSSKQKIPCLAYFLPNISHLDNLILNSYYYLPIKTYADFTDIDSLSAVLGFLGKQQPEVRMMVQILITPANFPWQKNAVKQAGHMILDTDQTSVTAEGQVVKKYAQNPQKLLMMQKASFQGGKALIRLMVGTDHIPPESFAFQSCRHIWYFFSWRR
jgi:hypothetical protein